MRILEAGTPVDLDDDLLIAGDNLTAMAALPAGAFDMAYLDPPFNTGRTQERALETARAPGEDRAADAVIRKGFHVRE
jgi:site-specific DNA-methyltransferase (adenine-specific)